MDDMGDGDVLNIIRQYQNSIVKHSELGNDAKILSYISKLYDMPITVAHLTETGIGRTVNSLRKYSGDVGHASRAIVSKWKNMVSKEEEEEEDDDDEEEEVTKMEQYSSPPSSSLPEKKKTKSSSHRSDSKHQTKPEHKSDSDRNSKRSESREENRSRSHRKEERKDSHHSTEKQHKTDSKHDKKRKHKDEIVASEKKKKRYSSESSNNEEEVLPVNGTGSQSDEKECDTSQSSQRTCENYRDSTQSPTVLAKSSNSDHRKNKKHKHRNHEKEKLTNGKSSHEESKSSKEVLPSTSKKEEKKKSPSKPKKGLILNQDNGIDSGSGASFAEALGMMGPASTPKITYKKKNPQYTPSSPTPSTSVSNKSNKTHTTRAPSTNLLAPNTNLLAPNLKLDPLDINITSQLPEITTNYKPIPQQYIAINHDPLSINALRHLSEEEALSVSISSKTQRTKVYSGNKTNWGYVPSLFNICVRVLQDNIEALEYTGGVPYEILKPVLERASPNQLLNTEYYNPYLIEESDELWELHCKKECKGMKRQEMESWRDMYLRCRDERDAKLKALTVNIKQSIDKSLPVRQTKLAYVDSVVKPPRGIARKQVKYGTDKPAVTPTSRLSAIASGSGGEKISVPNPAGRSHHNSAAAVIKPKKAPLMQKALQLIKSRFRR